ncbi:MAG: hypothetical protein IPL12_10950 [Bacteroidetes bacterium]|nr:hypothetical protein [Bacteroidota bacterium]
MGWKTFAELDEKLKRRINNAVLNATIIEDINFRPRVVHDLFHRLNTGGMPLTDQEIRNCVYTGIFNKQIIALNLNENWRLLLGKKSVDRRLRDAELILRFLSLLNSIQSYKPSMREFLSTYQELNKDNSSFLDSNQQIFERTINLILQEIGVDAFKITSAINKSVCDSIMVGIAQILVDGKEPINLKENYYKLISDSNYLKYVTAATSSESRVTGRINLARNYFRLIIFFMAFNSPSIETFKVELVSSIDAIQKCQSVVMVL